MVYLEKPLKNRLKTAQKPLKSCAVFELFFFKINRSKPFKFCAVLSGFFRFCICGNGKNFTNPSRDFSPNSKQDLSGLSGFFLDNYAQNLASI